MQPSRTLSLLLPTLLLVALGHLRPWLEVSMARHMAIEFPALIALGWLFARHVRPGPDTAFSEWNLSGIASMALATLILTAWMLPVAFDAAVLDWRVALLKVASLLGCGLLAGWCWPRLHMVTRSFFLLGASGMNVLFGILYMLAPQQLCSAYLSGEQWRAGLGLVAWGAAGLIGWLLWLMRLLARHTTAR